MSRPRRICVDVSYTRTQGGNVGITRTVRRLLAAFQAAQPESGISCVPVAHHSGGFRLDGGQSETGAPAVNQRNTARLYRGLTGGALRRFATAWLPPPLLFAAWSLANRWTFDALSAKEPSAEFGPGDWLILGDESWNYPVWSSVARARARGAKAVLVLYDLIPVRQPQFCAALFTQVFRRWLMRMLAECDAVLCISRATEDDLHAFCEEHRVAAPPAGHFRLGGDLPVSGTGGVRDTVREFVGKKVPCFVAIGTIEPRKNHRLLLTVFDRLWAAGVEVRLLVAGRPHPDCHRLIEQMRHHPEQGRRLMTVFDASDAELDLIYSGCRALLFPSLAEGFGLPLVEARARGCAVIASDLPALKELGDEGVAFFTPGCADELDALVRERAGAQSPSRPEPMQVFTWQDSADQFVGVTSGLLDARTAGAPSGDTQHGLQV